MVWYVKSRPCHPWRWGRGELVSSSRILWALSGDPETRSEAVIRFRVSGWQGKIATVSFHREEASSNPRLIFHSFCFRVSQPWCCWHLRPGNPFLWVSFVQCKIFSNILASTCWISMCFHSPPPPPPQIWQLEMSPGSKNYPRLRTTVCWSQWEGDEPRVMTSSFTRERFWKGESSS